MLTTLEYISLGMMIIASISYVYLIIILKIKILDIEKKLELLRKNI
jgi:hypothetical protein